MNLNDLEISVGNWHTGLTEASHLSTFFLTEPAMASQVITRVYNKMNGYKNALSFLTTGTGRTKEVDNIVYRWPLMGDSRKAVAITRSQDDSSLNDGGSTPGLNQTTFRIGLAEKWFTFGDVLVLDDNRYLCRVTEDAYQDGNDWIYTLQLVTKDPTLFVPQAIVRVGHEVSKGFNAVEHDMSSTSGDTTYATPFMMQNYLTTFRKKYAVSGAAQEKVLKISLMNPDSKEVASTWVKYAEWEFWSQWMDELEYAMIYGKLNVDENGVPTSKGASGRALYMGAGLEEQIAPANKRLYTTLSERVIRDFLDDLAYNGTEDGPRNYVALCGRQFMNLFDQAMKLSVSNFTLVDSKFVTGSGQELALGGQFKTYTGLNGDTITLKECPLYNDTLQHRQRHPQTGKPVESYKATFLNFKMNGNGESNIQKVYHKGREMASTYIEGLASPFGMKKNGTSSSPVDGYEFHVLSECGIMVQDPTNCGQLILDIDSIAA
jgi:hypothetical protein